MYALYLLFLISSTLTAAMAFSPYWDPVPAYGAVYYPTTRTGVKQNRPEIERHGLKSTFQKQMTTPKPATTTPGSSESLEDTAVEPENWEQKVNVTEYCRSMVSDELWKRMGEMKIHVPTPAEYANRTTNKLPEEFMFSDWPKNEQEQFMDTCKEQVTPCLSSRHLL